MTAFATSPSEIASQNVVTDVPTAEPKNESADDVDLVVPTATPEISIEQQVYSKIADSMVYIESETGLGTGFAIDSQYIVTNAHVVWPNESVRVTFSDFDSAVNVPVCCWDRMADIAVVGPLVRQLEPVRIAEGSIEEGSEVFAVGHTGQQFVASRNTFCGTAEWKAADLRLLEYSGTVYKGQSGGVLTNIDGEVLGIIGWPISESCDHRAIAISDVIERAAAMLAGRDPSGLGERYPIRGVPQNGYQLTLGPTRGSATFVTDRTPPIREDRIIVTSEHQTFASLRNSLGQMVSSERPIPGLQTTLTVPSWDFTYFLTVSNIRELEGDTSIASEIGLIPLHDPDDLRSINVGDNLHGALDYPGDIDAFRIALRGGQKIEVRARTISAAPQIGIEFDSGLYDQIVSTEDPTDKPPEHITPLAYEAPVGDIYTILVWDPRPIALGYMLSISEYSGALEISRPPTREGVFQTPAGPMLEHVTPSRSFAISYPVGVSTEVIFPPEGLSLSTVGKHGEGIGVAEVDMTLPGAPLLTFDRYLRTSGLENGLPLTDMELTSERELVISGENGALVREFVANGGLMKASTLTYVDEGNIGFMAIFYAPADVYDEWKEVVDYSISTFTVTGP